MFFLCIKYLNFHNNVVLNTKFRTYKIMYTFCVKRIKLKVKIRSNTCKSSKYVGATRI